MTPGTPPEVWRLTVSIRVPRAVINTAQSLGFMNLRMGWEEQEWIGLGWKEYLGLTGIIFLRLVLSVRELSQPRCAKALAATVSVHGPSGPS
jgi:hypothetical protein